MKLYHFAYKGPAFLGMAKVGVSFKNVQTIIFGPRGDNYVADWLVMRDRLSYIPPVRCTNLGFRELMSGSLSKLWEIIKHVLADYPNDIIIICPTVTSTLLKEDANILATHFNEEEKKKIFFLPIHHFKDEEDSAAEKTLLFLMEKFISNHCRGDEPAVNLIGVSRFNYNYLHDCNAIKQIISDIGLRINQLIPYETSVFELNKVSHAWVNILCDRTMSLSTVNFLKEKFNQPFISCFPYGVKNTRRFIEQLGKVMAHDYSSYVKEKEEAVFSKWKDVIKGSWRRKSACVFGEFTVSIGIAKILKEDIDCNLAMVGTYNTNYEKSFFQETQGLSNNILVTDRAIEVRKFIEKEKPDIILGTLNEERLASLLGIPFVGISSPTRYITTALFPSQSFIGYEGIDNLLYSMKKVLCK